MKIKVKNTQDVRLPKNATTYDAGYDMVATSQPAIVGEYDEDHKLWNEVQYIQYHTDLYIEPESCEDDKRYHTYIFPRSSISMRKLILANSVGLIDAGYRGEILVRFKYTPQPSDYKIINNKIFVEVDLNSIYKKGDKIAQLVISETQQVCFELTDSLSSSDRNSGGFGSTGA
jgi:dUTP pyrophosphatase